jgi:hypothetical protein
LVASNVLRGDYAGSRACADCHDAIYTTWESSAMHGMTRDAEAAAIRAPFDGASLRIGGDTCTMEMRGGNRTMRVVSASGSQTFRVTKVIGGRVREDFVGLDEHGEEHVLPATYVFATRSWRYKGYSVMVKERPRMATKGRWSRECLPCHNTLPLATMLYDDLDPSVPSYQGKLSDRVIPKTRAWTAHALDEPRLFRALADEIEFLGNTMERWWGKQYDRAALRALYGDDLSVNALRATLDRGKPHEQAVAIAVLGEARDRSAIPLLAAQLSHDYPLVRYFAQRALQTVIDEPVSIGEAESRGVGRRRRRFVAPRMPGSSHRDSLGPKRRGGPAPRSIHRPRSKQRQPARDRVDRVGPGRSDGAAGLGRYAVKFGGPGIDDQRARHAGRSRLRDDRLELDLGVDRDAHLGKPTGEPCHQRGIERDRECRSVRIRLARVEQDLERCMRPLRDHLALTHPEILAHDDHLLGGPGRGFVWRMRHGAAF